jgi:hypothetical protein
MFLSPALGDMPHLNLLLLLFLIANLANRVPPQQCWANTHVFRQVGGQLIYFSALAKFRHS